MKLLPYQQAVLDDAVTTLNATIAEVLPETAPEAVQALTMAIAGTITAALQVGLERSLQHYHSITTNTWGSRASCGSGTPIDMLPGGDPAGGEEQPE